MNQVSNGPDEFGIAVVPPGEFPDLDNAPVGISVDPKYYEFKDGESVRAVFCGFTLIKNGTLKAVVLQTKTAFLVNSGVSLVSQCEALRPGTPVMVTYTGKRNVKDGAQGARANIFVVNILQVPGLTVQAIPAPAAPPPPVPAIAAPAPAAAGSQPKANPKPKVARPLDPEVLKSYMPGKIAHHVKKGTKEATTSRGVLATMLNTAVGGEAQRQTLTKWLIGKAHISDMVDAEVMALLDWLECHLFSSVPPQYVIDEAKRAYEIASQIVDGEVKE